MTFEYRRVSLNTTLKNARIFDDDSWESDQDILNKIKKEPVDSEDTNQSWFEDRIASGSLKEEPWDSDDNAVSPIKQERIDFENKLRFDSNDSKDSTAADNEISQPSTERDRVRKNLKRKSDMLIKHEPETEDTPATPKKRLTSTSSKNSSPERKKFKDGNKKRKKEIERDPIVLKRRQKQIDYGKNTIGYDKYIEAVPKHKRTQTDPQTPDKYGKYSRRGFDGLIKQWRIKLHKYDPTDNIKSLDDNIESLDDNIKSIDDNINSLSEHL